MPNLETPKIKGPPTISQNMGDYLLAIFRRGEKAKRVTTSELAEALKVSLASVTDMIKKMAQLKLVRHLPYRGATLTRRGKKEALALLRKHRLSERFLYEKAGVDWDRVHEEAHKFEHVLSDEVEAKMAASLSDPTTCPHGSPVPTREGKILAELSEPVTELGDRTWGKIVRISTDEPKLLRYLASLGLMPGVLVCVEGKAPLGGPVMVRVGKATYALGRDVASQIWVKPEPAKG
jgi:DtxR family Mn-dependent transcriptional regulator